MHHRWHAATLSNAALAVTFDLSGGHARPVQLKNRLSGRNSILQGELFELKLRDGTILHASDFHFEAPVGCVPMPGMAEAARQASRSDMQALEGTLLQNAGGLTVRWRASITDAGAYLRESFAVSTAKDVDIAGLSLIDLQLPNASVAGTADGTPICVAAPGQLRRAFAAYVEAERAHPFRTFLHYNSWYDIGYFSRYTQADALGAIEHIGNELVVNQHVVMDSFLFDDGWDDTAHLWQFNDGFPHGFAPIRAAAEKFGAEPGVWLSPWGGYGPPREARLVAANAAGYEVQFKLDGTGSPDKVTPGSAFDSDFAAARIMSLRGREATGSAGSPIAMPTPTAASCVRVHCIL